MFPVRYSSPSSASTLPNRSYLAIFTKETENKFVRVVTHVEPGYKYLSERKVFSLAQCSGMLKYNEKCFVLKVVEEHEIIIICVVYVSVSLAAVDAIKQKGLMWHCYATHTFPSLFMRRFLSWPL
jgi:hypothetical protein